MDVETYIAHAIKMSVKGHAAAKASEKAAADEKADADTGNPFDAMLRDFYGKQKPKPTPKKTDNPFDDMISEFTTTGEDE